MDGPNGSEWQHLRPARRLVTRGGEVRLFALGDGIVDDTMRSGWVATLQDACPKARTRTPVDMCGGGGYQAWSSAR